ncbi:MAG: PilZ domain-containing protein [Pseudomonadales bacterium]|nr:PilZ domain-containing protein [Pseudomonadales bacterium]
MTSEEDPANEARGLDLRHHRRVDVRLAVTVVLDRNSMYEARTCNVSEGGMLLGGYRGPQLPPGRLIGLNMGGVICDASDGNDNAERYLMRVVRQAGETLALRFAGEIS